MAAGQEIARIAKNHAHAGFFKVSHSTSTLPLLDAVQIGVCSLY